MTNLQYDGNIYTVQYVKHNNLKDVWVYKVYVKKFVLKDRKGREMKKKLIAIAATALMVVALAGCSSNSSSSSSENATNNESSAASEKLGDGSNLTFVTGGESGTYYAVGGVIANDVTNNCNLSVTAVAGNGSQANVVELEDGTAQLGFCQSDVMSYAYDGTNIFKDTGAINCFSTVAALYDETVQIVTCDPDIKTVADLKGKTVSVGAAGSGVYFNAIDVLGAYGLSLDDINPSYQSFKDSADSLTNGQIDAAFIVAGAPTSAIVELSTTKQAYLVSIEDAQVDELLKSSPYYSKSVIPAGTYNGIDEDITTVSVQAVIIAANTVSEDAIYAFLSEMYGNIDALSDAHAKFEEMSIEKGASITSVPYHPGAVKYFAEQGITVK